MVVTIELSDGFSEMSRLKRIMANTNTFGFNSNNYDIPIILCAIKYQDNQKIYDMSNDIINNSLVQWQSLQKYSLTLSNKINHFDIMQVAPGVGASLKLYGGRMNSLRLQDLPIEPGTILNDEQLNQIKSYCVNDLDTTIDLYNNIKAELKLRENLSSQYQLDLLSKSDAQIAEAIMKSELQKLNQDDLKKFKPTLKYYCYNVPDFIKFENESCKTILSELATLKFCINEKGKIINPLVLRKHKIKINNREYQMGIGGLHSVNEPQSIITNKDTLLIEKDASSHYPSIILNFKLFPSHLGTNFLKVYKSIVQQRLKAKKDNDKIANESLKIVINGTFGKLGNRYSIMYSPQLLLQVTLTGQLTLLMLIEQLEVNNISVVSANTDGVMCHLHKSQSELFAKICSNWEKITTLNLEERRGTARPFSAARGWLPCSPPASTASVLRARPRCRAAYAWPRAPCRRLRCRRRRRAPVRP